MIETNYRPTSPTNGILVIEAKAADMESARREAVVNLGSKQAIPGFKLGAAPPEIAEKHIDKKLLIKEFFNLFVLRSAYQAWNQLNLRPVVRPKVNVVNFEPFELIKIEAQLDIIADVKVPDWTQIELPNLDDSVQSKDLEQTLKILINRQSTWQVVDRPAQIGDQVWFNYKTDTTDYHKNQETKVVLDPDQVSEKLIAKFLNKSAGETVESIEKVRIDRPIFHFLGLTDKSADNKFQEKKVIHKISKVEACTKRANLEDIAQAGKTTVDKLRQELHNQLLSDKNKRNQAQTRRVLVQFLSGNTTANVDPKILKLQTESLDRQLKSRFKFDSEVADAESQYQQKLGMSSSQYQQLVTESARRTINLMAALSETAVINNINLENLTTDVKDKPPFLAYFEQTFLNSRSNHFVLNNVIGHMIEKIKNPATQPNQPGGTQSPSANQSETQPSQSQPSTAHQPTDNIQTTETQSSPVDQVEAQPSQSQPSTVHQPTDNIQSTETQSSPVDQVETQPNQPQPSASHQPMDGVQSATDNQSFNKSDNQKY